MFRECTPSGVWARLVPHGGGSPIDLRAPNVTIGSGTAEEARAKRPRSADPIDGSGEAAHVQIGGDRFLSRLHFELRRRSDGRVDAIRHSSNWSFLNGLQLPRGLVVPVERDMDNARYQHPDCEADEPMLFACVPNKAAAQMLQQHASCFTGFTIQPASAIQAVDTTRRAVLPPPTVASPLCPRGPVSDGSERADVARQGAEAPAPAEALPQRPAAAAPAAAPAPAPATATATAVAPARSVLMIFAGVRALFPPVGNLAGSRRRQTLQNVLQQKGGTVVERAADATHVVLDPHREAAASVEELQAIPLADWPRVVTDEWISRCSREKAILQRECLHPSDPFLAKATQATTPSSMPSSCVSALAGGSCCSDGVAPSPQHGGNACRRLALGSPSSFGQPGPSHAGFDTARPSRTDGGNETSASGAADGPSSSDNDLPLVDSEEDECGEPMNGDGPRAASLLALPIPTHEAAVVGTGGGAVETGSGSGAAVGRSATGEAVGALGSLRQAHSRDSQDDDNEDTNALGPQMAREAGYATTAEWMFGCMKELAKLEAFKDQRAFDNWGRTQHNTQFIAMLDDLLAEIEPISAGQLRGLKRCHGVSDKSVDKLLELYTKGRLRRLDELKQKPELRALADLTAVWGIGDATAREFLSHGVRSRAELLARPQLLAKLRPEVTTSLQLHDDFSQRIPRAEIASVGERIIDLAMTRLRPTPIRAEVCGSYRRGAASSTDVDVVFFLPSHPAAREGREGGLPRLAHTAAAAAARAPPGGGAAVVPPSAVMAAEMGEMDESDGGRSSQGEAGAVPRTGVVTLDFLLQLIALLHEEGVLTHDLTMPKDGSGPELAGNFYMGVYKLPGQPYRRIDLRAVRARGGRTRD